MSETAPLYTNEAGVTKWMTVDGDKYIFSATQDAEPILDQNKAMATHNDGYNADRTMRRVASIPAIIGLKWLSEEGWWYQNPHHADRLMRKLNDPDWMWLRTADGRIGMSNGVLR